MPKRSRKVIDHFYKVVNKNKFYEIAESVLADVDDLEELARCSLFVAERQPGGSFYRARFWNKISKLLTRFYDNEKEQKKEFLRLCKTINLHSATAKNYIIQGQAINKVDESLLNVNLLREVPEELLRKAQRQKERAGEYLIKAVKILEENPQTSHSTIHRIWCKENGNTKSNLDIIKPSDWWAFSHPKWRKDTDFSGSIPGEVYANALYYFAPETGIAVDAMAGSGMLKRVYEDRHKWQKNLNFSLKLHLFDLHPCRDFIQEHNARHPLPIKADWIFIDPPYFSQSSQFFNGDIAAAKTYQEYLFLLKDVILAMEQSLNPHGRLCIFLPKWSGLNPENPNHDIPSDVCSLATSSGLKWIDKAFVSRGRQQQPGSATKNNKAKRNRRMLSDTCVLNVFEKWEVSNV